MRWGIRREKCVEAVAASLSFEGKLCVSILTELMMGKHLASSACCDMLGNSTTVGFLSCVTRTN